jgi:hypothetical protein
MEKFSIEEEPSIPTPHFCSNGALCASCSLASCSRYQYSVSILQDLIFSIRQEIDDIHFHMEHLGQHANQLETMLAFMLRAMQAYDLDIATPVGAILSSTPQMDNTGNVAFTWDMGKRAGEVEINRARHIP